MSDESGYSEENSPKPKCHLLYPDCQKSMSPQDSRGWEQILISGHTGEGVELRQNSIWLCPNCIMGFQACKDLKEAVEENAVERGEVRLLHFHNGVVQLYYPVGASPYRHILG